MNNLAEWAEGKRILKEGFKNWGPHFEALKSAAGEEITAFFLLNDTDVEWKIYNEVPEETAKAFSEHVEDAKEELLERVEYDTEGNKENAQEETPENMSMRLEDLIKHYEKKTGLKTSELTFNMIFYSEWTALPEEMLEEKNNNITQKAT